MENENKKVVFSALKPTGDLTIGNYIGALKNMVNMVDEYDCYYAVADLHALTVENAPADLRRRTYDFMAFFLAIGSIPTSVPCSCKATFPSTPSSAGCSTATRSSAKVSV